MPYHQDRDRGGMIFALVIALIVMSAGIIIVLARQVKDEPAPKPTDTNVGNPPCSTSEQRCIKITLPDGRVFEFNDFQFYGRDCISFDSLPDGDHHYYCGEYKLDWIGPDPTKEKPRSI
jgi:hypothetical protein